MTRPGESFLNSATPIICRPALPKDTDSVLEVTRHIWEGEDYIPEVWSEWLADPQGLLAVAEYGGSVAGLCKLSQLDPEQWWLEGMRVRPDLQRRGIASHLLDYLLDYWRRYGGGALRLATASERIAVHQMCHRTGFTKVTEITPYSAECYLNTGKEALAYVRVLDHEIENASRFAKTSESMALSHGLMDLDWRWGAPSSILLKIAVEQGQAWWWRGKRGLLITEQQSDPERGPRSLIRSLACEVIDINTCLVDTLGLASSLGSERVIWFAPMERDLISILESAGFRRDWEGSLYIYQKSHPKLTLK